MEGNIFKPEVTKEDLKRKLEALMERLESAKEDEISRINDDIVELGIQNRPDLEELVKRELLELIPLQLEDKFSQIYQHLVSENDTASWYDIADSIYDQHLQDNSLSYGYFTWNANNEKALMAIRWHKDEYYNYVYEAVLNDAKFYSDEWDENFELGAWMRHGFSKFFEDYASKFQCELDELKKGHCTAGEVGQQDYEIDIEALSLGDIMFIHNKLSEELKAEKKYSDKEILENLKEYEEL